MSESDQVGKPDASSCSSIMGERGAVWDGEAKATQGEMGTGREERLQETAAWQSGDSSFRMEGVASSVSLVLHSWTRTEFAGVGLSSLSCRANNERECES